MARMSRREMREAGLLRHPSTVDHEDVDVVDEGADQPLGDESVVPTDADDAERHIDGLQANEPESVEPVEHIDADEPEAGANTSDVDEVAHDDAPPVDVEHADGDDAENVSDTEDEQQKAVVEPEVSGEFVDGEEFDEDSLAHTVATDAVTDDEDDLGSTRAMTAADVAEPADEAPADDEVPSDPPARTSVFDRFSPQAAQDTPAAEVDEDEDVEDDPDYREDLRAKLAADRDSQPSPEEAVTETVDVAEADDDEESGGSSIKTILFFALLIVVGFGLGILIGLAIFGGNDSTSASAVTTDIMTTINPGVL